MENASLHVCETQLSRRKLLTLGAMAGLAAAMPSPLMAATTRARGNRELSFVHTHTGETLKTTYCCDGKYVLEELERVNHFLRDFRVNEVKPIDPKLLDLLHDISNEVGTAKPFHVISGYRSPKTNQMLQTRGGAHSGVASKSLHMVGKAIDIRMPGTSLSHLRDGAKSLKLGGVGYYPGPNFVHVDTGRVRCW